MRGSCARRGVARCAAQEIRAAHDARHRRSARERGAGHLQERSAVHRRAARACEATPLSRSGSHCPEGWRRRSSASQARAWALVILRTRLRRARSRRVRSDARPAPRARRGRVGRRPHYAARATCARRPQARSCGSAQRDAHGAQSAARATPRQLLLHPRESCLRSRREPSPLEIENLQSNSLARAGCKRRAALGGPRLSLWWRVGGGPRQRGRSGRTRSIRILQSGMQMSYRC